MQAQFSCETCKLPIYGTPVHHEYYSWDTVTKTSPKKIMTLCKPCDDAMDADQERLRKSFGKKPDSSN